RGIPEAFLLGKDFIGHDDVVLILGDNLFHGNLDFLRNAVTAQASKKDHYRARIFGYPVADPERYGVVDFCKTTHKIYHIEEKPQKPKSNYAIPGLYIFDSSVVHKTAELKPSARGELEITDVILSYLSEGSLCLYPMTRGIAWLDM